MVHRNILLTAGLAAALILSACAQATPTSAPSVEMDGFKGAPAESQLGLMDRTSSDAVTNATGAGSAPGYYQEEPAAAPAPATIDRLVIKNASLNLVVKDPQVSLDQVTALAERVGGFVVSSRTYKQGYDAEGVAMLYGQISIRVPAERFNEALAELRSGTGVVRVEDESISGDDVTAQYTDLQSQLKNLEAAEVQLTAIMEEAKRTEDVLNVYNQLVSIRGQIEQIKGQMKYYEESAAMSLISMTLMPDIASQPITPDVWAPEGVAKQAVEALVNTLQALGTAAIWFGIYTLPLLLLVGLPILAVIFGLRRLMRRGPKAPVVAKS